MKLRSSQGRPTSPDTGRGEWGHSSPSWLIYNSWPSVSEEDVL